MVFTRRIQNKRHSGSPSKVLDTGASDGLDIYLSSSDNNTDYLCRGPVQGFNFILHTPDEVPKVFKQYFNSQFDSFLGGIIIL